MDWECLLYTGAYYIRDFTVVAFKRTHSSSRLGWSAGWRPLGTEPVFIEWTKWWQHYYIVCTLVKGYISSLRHVINYWDIYSARLELGWKCQMALFKEEISILLHE